MRFSSDADLYSRRRQFENNYINMSKKSDGKDEFKDCEDLIKIFLALYISLYANCDPTL